MSAYAHPGVAMRPPLRPARMFAVGAVTAALVVAMALVGFAVGRTHRITGNEAVAARARVEHRTFSISSSHAYKQARDTGYAHGVTTGAAYAVSAAKTDALRDASRLRHSTVASSPTSRPSSASAPHLCPGGQYTTPAGTCSPNPPNFGTPPANSPEGRAMINADPTCQNPPPPPGYSGPVQCNNP